MDNHTEVLNYIIQTKDFKKYLEIGSQHGRNFYAIACDSKTGVDPDKTCKATHYMTSDEFFAQNKCKFEIIFIDGDHTADQVRRDFINAMACLSENGIIVLHDTNPLKEEWTKVPRDSKQWTGNVYLFVCNLLAEFRTLSFDYGITVVKKCEYVCYDDIIPWSAFDVNRKTLLKLVTEEEFKQWLQPA